MSNAELLAHAQRCLFQRVVLLALPHLQGTILQGQVTSVEISHTTGRPVVIISALDGSFVLPVQAEMALESCILVG